MRLDHLLSKEKVRVCVLILCWLEKVNRKSCPVVMRLEETPVPIPNTTVKIQPADDTRARGSGKAGGCRAFFLYYITGLIAQPVRAHA